MKAQAAKDEALLYDSKYLTTHAAVVGMTGSGKTGLCIGLIEEAAKLKGHANEIKSMTNALAAILPKK